MNGINIRIAGSDKLISEFKKSDIYLEFIDKARSLSLQVVINEETVFEPVTTVYTEKI